MKDSRSGRPPQYNSGGINDKAGITGLVPSAKTVDDQMPELGKTAG